MTHLGKSCLFVIICGLVSACGHRMSYDNARHFPGPIFSRWNVAIH